MPASKGGSCWVDTVEKITTMATMQSPGAMHLYHRKPLRQLLHHALVV